MILRYFCRDFLNSIYITRSEFLLISNNGNIYTQMSKSLVFSGDFTENW